MNLFINVEINDEDRYCSKKASRVLTTLTMRKGHFQQVCLFLDRRFENKEELPRLFMKFKLSSPVFCFWLTRLKKQKKMQSQHIIVAAHACVSIYQTLLACFAVASIFGQNAISSWIGWMIFFIVAYCLDLVETVIVAVIGNGNLKTRPRSIATALWHWIYNLLIGILLLVYFVSFPDTILERLTFTAAFQAGLIWHDIMVTILAGWLVEVGIILLRAF